jgi:hypothetical protein
LLAVLPWMWTRYVPPKRRLVFTGLCGVNLRTNNSSLPLLSEPHIQTYTYKFFGGSTAFCWALAAFSWSYTQAEGLCERGISPSQSFYLNTGQHKHSIHTYTHQTSMPWVGTRSQRPSEPREFML